VVSESGLFQRLDRPDLCYVLSRSILDTGQHHLAFLTYNILMKGVACSDIFGVRRSFDEAHNSIQSRQRMGADVDTVHLLLGGDHVTNEAIYDGQAFDIDENIKEQMNRATAVYDDEIERLSKLYPCVQVVCIGRTERILQ
jgi:hypothetical protein